MQKIRWCAELHLCTYACYHGQKDVVQLFLEHSDSRIQLNTRNKDGRSAFMYACNYGHKDVVQLFPDNFKRIELSTRDNHGWTAMMIACRRGHQNILQSLQSLVVNLAFARKFKHL